MIETNSTKIPDELKSESFMLWRLEKREGRYKKPSINPHSGFRGDVTDPSQWTDYENALKIKSDDPNLYHNLGVVFTKLDNIDKSIEYYSKSIKLNTKNSLA